MTPVCFILWKQVNLIEENVFMIGTVGDSFFMVFRLSRIERFTEMFAVLQENRMKC